MFITRLDNFDAAIAMTGGAPAAALGATLGAR